MSDQEVEKLRNENAELARNLAAEESLSTAYWNEIQELKKYKDMAVALSIANSYGEERALTDRQKQHLIDVCTFDDERLHPKNAGFGMSIARVIAKISSYKHKQKEDGEIIEKLAILADVCSTEYIENSEEDKIELAKNKMKEGNNTYGFILKTEYV